MARVTSHALLLLLLLGFMPPGSSQLTFNNTENVTKTGCDKTVRLPCLVTNLRVHNTTALYVEWKYRGLTFYTFDGSATTNSTKVRRDFSSAALDLHELPKGDISLTIRNTSQAVQGRYTCDVTELSRSGVCNLTLTYVQVHVFELKDCVVFTVLLCLGVLAFWIHFATTFTSFYKYKPSTTAVNVIALTGIILSILVVVGLWLLFTKDYSPSYLAGLGIAVIPPIGLILVLQHFLLPSNFHLMIFQALKVLGYVIAVVGCGLCLATCPPTLTQAAVLISGIALFTVFMMVDLVYSVLQEYYSKLTIPY